MIESIYDSVNGDQYRSYADFAKAVFNTHADIKVAEVLDLGCGTGGITALLAETGYDTVGVDISADMLMQAMQNTAGKNVLLLNQDMRSFELYGTVQGIVCSFDTLNYLADEGELTQTLSLCRLYLEKGGVMVADLNTLYRYERVYASNSFVYEFGEDMLVWQNNWDEKTGECEFYLTMFAETDGVYSREDEVTLQKYFSPEAVRACAEKAGFTDIVFYGDKGFSPLGEECEKMYVILK